MDGQRTRKDRRWERKEQRTKDKERGKLMVECRWKDGCMENG